MLRIFFQVLVLGCANLPHSLAGQLHARWEGGLPKIVNESSGILLMGAHLVSINDSGNAPVLYELDTISLEVVREVTVANAKNTDWEALAADEEFIYIGDFGNNLGKRKDLKVLRIPKAEYSAKDRVEAESISFSYGDQSDFSGTGNSDWDAEALIAGADSLWIFTKEWQRQGTTVYSLPKTPGTYTARKSTWYNAGGLVTGAATDPGGGMWYLLGYSRELQPFIVQVPTASPAEGFSTGSKKYKLTVGLLREDRTNGVQADTLAVGAQRELPVPVGFAQAEGITVSPDGDLLISSEAFDRRFISLPPALYRIPSGALQQVPGTRPGPGQR